MLTLAVPAAAEAAPAATPAAAAAAPAAAPVAKKNRDWVKVVGVCAFAAMLCYLDRTNISTAIVPMAEQFGWNKQFCGAVLSAFFAGYGATQVLGGQWSDKYGGSAVLAGGLALWSVATALTPFAAAWGTVPLLVARTLLGMGQVRPESVRLFGDPVCAVLCCAVLAFGPALLHDSAY
jgi:ACS family sodium-dependent inorganic phosphate cotransporter